MRGSDRKDRTILIILDPQTLEIDEYFPRSVLLRSCLFLVVSFQTARLMVVSRTLFRRTVKIGRF